MFPAHAQLEREVEVLELALANLKRCLQRLVAAMHGCGIESRIMVFASGMSPVLSPVTVSEPRPPEKGT